MTLRARFAVAGDPAVEGLTENPACDRDSERNLDIGYELEVKTGVVDTDVPPPSGTLPPFEIPVSEDE